MNILFVCTGNTCRSPMAEAILKSKYPKTRVKSAGVYAGEGFEASGNTIKALEERDITLNHHTQPVTEQLLEWADLVLTMTSQHKQLLMMEYPDDQDKLFTLKEYALDSDEARPKTLDSNLNSYDVSDPFGGDLHTYRETLSEIESYINRLIRKIED